MGTVLEKYHKLQLKHKTTDKLKVALQTIWEEMPREYVNRAVAIFTIVVTPSIYSNSVHLASLHPHLITNKLTLFRDTNRLTVKIMLGMLGLSWLK